MWAYNTQPYFNKYYPKTNVGEYMSWIPLVGGSLGVVLGGFISDRLIKNRGFYMRVWVLIFSQVCVQDENNFTRKRLKNFACLFTKAHFRSDILSSYLLSSRRQIDIRLISG